MIQLTDSLWIGDSDDGYVFASSEVVGGVLNVAEDLRGECGWPDVEYAQVGLVDGPGNEITSYCAAILTLAALLRRHQVVVVYDHDGGRALAVCMMYLNLVGGKYRPHTTAWSHWLTWKERLAHVMTDVRANEVLPQVHTAHKEVFTKIPYGVLEVLL